MKKTLVIIILVVYISSIVVVNLFGLEDKVFDGVDYVNRIECETVIFQNNGNPVELGPKQIIEGVPLFVFNFIPAPAGKTYTTEPESINSNPNIVKIDPKAIPATADNTKLKVIFDEAALDGVAIYHEASRSFIFLKEKKIVDIIIEASDGHKASTKISIMGLVPK